MSAFKIGLYCRVSTEEQAENPEGSIKNQEQRLKDYIRFKNGDGNFGKITGVFIDAGISAKDMKRPQLQRLLDYIRNKEVNLVMVTDLSRFTRSTKDFSNLWDFMGAHGCKFQSLRENFDSTTAAGEMIMFTLANFAQFERKQTAERISTAFAARARRGLYNGGSVPLGFDINPTKPGVLAVNPEESEIVKKVFMTFLKVGTVSHTAKALNDEGITLKRNMSGSGGVRAGFFKVDTVYRILTNRSYIGLRAFKERNEVKIAKAVWPAVIDEDMFARVQKILAKNKSHKKPHSKTRFPYLLSGNTFCASCGDRMAGKSAHGKNGKIAYYEHSWATKANAALSKKVFSCEPTRILAKKIEPVVWSSVQEFLTRPEIAELMIKQAKKSYVNGAKEKESQKLSNKIDATNRQIEALAERLSSLPKEINPSPIYVQMTKLQAIQKSLEEKRSNGNKDLTPNDVPIDFENLESSTRSLKALLSKEDDPVIKTSVIQKVVEKILVNPQGIEVYFHLGKTHYLRNVTDNDIGSQGQHLSTSASTASDQTLTAIKKGPTRPLESCSSKNQLYFLKDRCSNSLTIGGGAGN